MCHKYDCIQSLEPIGGIFVVFRAVVQICWLYDHQDICVDCCRLSLEIFFFLLMCLEYNSTKTVPQPKNFFVSPCLHCLAKIWQSDQPENF